MSLRGYYRQFEAMSEAEVNEGLREQAQERRRQALERVELLDLSQTTWPALPHPYVVNAVTYVARRGLHRYPRGTDELRGELAHRHELPPERFAIGHGAAALLLAATAALLEPGQELICPWPAYPLYPLMARRAGGHAVPVRDAGVDGLLSALTDRTRLLALARPNDPDGALIDLDELERLLSALPDQVAVLLDEALVDYIDAEPVDGALALLERHPRLLVFRSFSKAWGLAGLRCGYAVGGPGSEELLERLEPPLGIGDLTRAGAVESLRTGVRAVGERARAVAGEREALSGSLRDLGLEVPPSQANFLWVSHPALGDGELAALLARAGIVGADGSSLGEPRHVRLQVRDGAASARVLSALRAGLRA